jgi:hypothetical protein
LIRHRAGWKEERRLLSEQLRNAGLEPAGGGVAIEVVIADFRGGDGLSHRLGRPGDGVAAEIDRHGAEGRAEYPESEGRAAAGPIILAA